MTDFYSDEINDFINQNLNVDTTQLLLKKSPFSDVSMSDIVAQIKGRKLSPKKFPFLDRKGIVFPPQLNVEQSSSQATANYKSNLIGGESFIDLTSGFGIDAYFLSQNFDSTTLVEQNATLLDIVKHNWSILGQKANFVQSDLFDFLASNTSTYDWVYLDPARRNENQQKVFLLEDLSPDILEIKNKLFSISKNVMVKLSPLIDLHYLIENIPEIKEIYIIGLKNEVKEVVLVLEKELQHHNPKITAVNIESGESEFSFQWQERAQNTVEYSSPLNFLYIPNTSVLKSGASDVLANRFQLKKLHPNTQLYTSGIRITDFPGRVLAIESIKPKEIKKGTKFNIISKNHPLDPKTIKKKYKLIDGGDDYLIFTQSIEGKHCLKSIG